MTGRFKSIKNYGIGPANSWPVARFFNKMCHRVSSVDDVSHLDHLKLAGLVSGLQAKARALS